MLLGPIGLGEIVVAGGDEGFGFALIDPVSGFYRCADDGSIGERELFGDVLIC